jgi:N-acetylmuramoyl-L-alanine amidase
MHPSHRLLQLAFNSMGFSPGKVDGWWGGDTQSAAEALFKEGPAKTSAWSVRTLQNGLAGLGYDVGAVDGHYGGKTRKALGWAIDAGGAPAASFAIREENLVLERPVLQGVSHGNVLRHGAANAVIRNFMMHTAATPGSWWRGKSNRQMLEEIRRWHADPKSKGGRGWSDIGYGEVIFPDGEALTGRPLHRIGAGARGYNRGWMHVCMIPVETIGRMGLPEDFYTPETLASMRQRIEHYSCLTPIERLAGHNETAAKLCPGFRVIDRDWTDRAVA